MTTLIVKNNDVPEEKIEMYKLQVEVLENIAEWVRKKIPNFITMCDGPTYQVAILIGNPEKTNMELRYEVPFIREDFLTPSAEKCHEFMYKWVSSAFNNDAHWQIKTFEKLPDEYFNVIEDKG